MNYSINKGKIRNLERIHIVAVGRPNIADAAAEAESIQPTTMEGIVTPNRSHLRWHTYWRLSLSGFCKPIYGIVCSVRLCIDGIHVSIRRNQVYILGKVGLTLQFDSSDTNFTRLNLKT